MDARERVTRALRGETVDQVPWTIYENLLPRGAVERTLRNQGLALLRHVSVYTTDRPNVVSHERSVIDQGEVVQIRTLSTPIGAITEKRKIEPGYNSSWIIEHFIKEPRDYEVLEYVIRDTHFRPELGDYDRAVTMMGTDGIVNTGVSRIPFNRLWIEYSGIDRMMLDRHDRPDLVKLVLDAMIEKDREMWRIVAECPAEFIWAPDNVTSLVMGPRLFDEYFAPYYEELCSVMHACGKRVYAHMDGATRSIIENVKRTPLDIIEAFTPEPTGDLTLHEALAAWRDKILWINYPSGVLVEPASEVARTTRDLLHQATPGDRFLLGVTENVPEFAIASSLGAIGEVLDEIGALPLT